MTDSDQTRPVLDPPESLVSRPPTSYLWQTYDHLIGDHAPIADQPRNIIDTVLVDPDDVIGALRFNARPPSARRSTGGDGAGDAHRADDSPPDWPIADD